MTLFGVDVHPQFQPGFNFDQADKDGCTFAFVKASQGDTGVPPGFDAYFARAASNMQVVGMYHFLDSTMSGADQADMFVNVVRRNGGAAGKLLAVDFETYGNASPTNGNLSGFVKRFKSLTGGHPIICYSNYNFWNSGTPTGNPADYNIDALWEAQVFSVNEQRNDPEGFYRNQWLPWYRQQRRLSFNSVPTPFRQFTWGGLVGGLHVDTDAFEGSIDDLKRLTRS